MKIIVVDDTTKLREEKNKQCKVPFIWLTTQKHPKEQRKREDKEPFYYLPSTIKSEEGEN